MKGIMQGVSDVLTKINQYGNEQIHSKPNKEDANDLIKYQNLSDQLIEDEEDLIGYHFNLIKVNLYLKN
jgi:hypothetical protein